MPRFVYPFICWWTFGAIIYKAARMFVFKSLCELTKRIYKELLGFHGGSAVKNLPAMQETWVWFLGGDDPLEKEMATHSSILAWRTPWTEEPGWLQSIELRVVCDWITEHNTWREAWLRDQNTLVDCPQIWIVFSGLWIETTWLSILEWNLWRML